jgi:hypothetical protein
MAAHTACRLLVLLATLPVVFVGTRAHAACVDPAQLARSTFSIVRHFDETERDTSPDLIGISGTGWFLSPTTIITVAHVAEAMKLSSQDWKSLEIADEHAGSPSRHASSAWPGTKRKSLPSSNSNVPFSPRTPSGSAGNR